MPYEIIRHNENLLKKEKQLEKFGFGGRIKVCLVYPNTYHVGMSNLGFLTIYRQINSMPDFFCDRAFLPDPHILKMYKKGKRKLIALISEKPLQEFDILAFSISYELDYINLLRILDLAGIPLLSKDRDESFPLIIAGGAAVSINPEIIADFVDIFVAGEGEEVLERLLPFLGENIDNERFELLEGLTAISGVYAPSLYEIKYNKNGFIKDIVNPTGAPMPIERQVVRRLPGFTHSTIITPNTEFSDSFLIEISRGCPYSCGFCSVGGKGRPYRKRSLDLIKKSVDAGFEMTGRIGLLGAAVANHPRLMEILEYVEVRGGKVSFSALRADALKPGMVQSLFRLGQKTITLAPEVGSQRLRSSINKTMKNEDILRVASQALDAGFREIRVYFMVGLPGETNEDVESSIAMISSLESMARKYGGRVVVSLNQFIPKPGTAMELAPLLTEKAAIERIKRMEEPFLNNLVVEFRVESLKEMFLQAFLCRAPRTWSKYLLNYYMKAFSTMASKLKKIKDPSIDSLIFMPVPPEIEPPWRIFR